MPKPRPGDAFLHYTVTREIESGFDGAIYEVRHRVTGVAWGLKTMHQEDLSNASKRARALATAKGHYRVQHRNVLEVVDLNFEPDGMVWILTELLQGLSIGALIERQGRLSPLFALPAAIQAGHGLQAIHEANIVHRDVTPKNLFYTDAREIKVIDLGIAKVYSEPFDTTQGRLPIGTPDYMDPEAFTDNNFKPDARVDVFGLGMTLWVMLAGRRPYGDFGNTHGELAELIRRQVYDMPAPLSEIVPDLPRPIDNVVRRAIMKERAKRYESMGEMVRAMEDVYAWLKMNVASGRVVVTVPPGEPAPPGNPNARGEYRAPEPVVALEPPPAAPSRRVVIASNVRATPTPLAATLPLNAGPLVPLGGHGAPILPPAAASVASPLAATAPLQSSPLAATASLHAAPLAATAPLSTARSPAPQPLAQTVVSATGLPIPGRETPVAGSRTDPSIARAATTRSPAPMVAFVVLTAAAAAVAVWHVRSSVPAPAPAPASSAVEPSALPASVPNAPLSANEPPTAPSPAADSSPPPAASSARSADAGAHPHRLAYPPVHLPSSPAPVAAPAQNPNRLFGIEN